MEKRKKQGRENRSLKFSAYAKPHALACYENVVRVSERQIGELKLGILAETGRLEKLHKERLLHLRQQELHQGRAVLYRFLAGQRNTFGLVKSLAELPGLIRRERGLAESEKENIAVIGRRIEMFPRRG